MAGRRCWPQKEHDRSIKLSALTDAFAHPWPTSLYHTRGHHIRSYKHTHCSSRLSFASDLCGHPSASESALHRDRRIHHPCKDGCTDILQCILHSIDERLNSKSTPACIALGKCHYRALLIGALPYPALNVRPDPSLVRYIEGDFAECNGS